MSQSVNNFGNYFQKHQAAVFSRTELLNGLYLYSNRCGHFTKTVYVDVTAVSQRCAQKGVLFVVMTLSVHRHVFLPMMTLQRQRLQRWIWRKTNINFVRVFFFFISLLTHLSFAACLQGTSLILFTIRGIFFPSLLHAAALLFDISIRSCHAHWRHLKIRSCFRQKYCTELSECKSTEEAPESIMMFFFKTHWHSGHLELPSEPRKLLWSCFYGLLHRRRWYIELMDLLFEMRSFIFLKRWSVVSFFFLWMTIFLCHWG